GGDRSVTSAGRSWLTRHRSRETPHPEPRSSASLGSSSYAVVTDVHNWLPGNCRPGGALRTVTFVSSVKPGHVRSGRKCGGGGVNHRCPDPRPAPLPLPVARGGSSCSQAVSE